MGYSGQLEHFASCFRRGETPRESVRDGARVLRILAAGYLAAARGAPVDVRDVPSDRSPIELLS
jgi:predicted dehydrogenase